MPSFSKKLYLEIFIHKNNFCYFCYLWRVFKIVRTFSFRKTNVYRIHCQLSETILSRWTQAHKNITMPPLLWFFQINRYLIFKNLIHLQWKYMFHFFYAILNFLNFVAALEQCLTCICSSNEPGWKLYLFSVADTVFVICVIVEIIHEFVMIKQ